MAELGDIYDRLFRHFGPRHWWPAETPFEVVVGAILTQSVAWRNVEKAIATLKDRELLTPQALYDAPVELIQECVIPTRYYVVKAKKLKSFVTHLVERYDGDLAVLMSQDLGRLRRELLGIWGLGPETVDSILLYAGNHPIFVVDAYTRRILVRLGVWPDNIAYDEMQRYFMSRLPADAPLYNEYHALLDGLGHHLCHASKPKCPGCPLLDICREAARRQSQGETT